MTNTDKAPPQTLGPAGRRAWRAALRTWAANGYTWADSDLEALARDCELADLLADLTETFTPDQCVTSNSQGAVVSPLFRVIKDVEAMRAKYRSDLMLCPRSRKTRDGVLQKNKAKPKQTDSTAQVLRLMAKRNGK